MEFRKYNSLNQDYDAKTINHFIKEVGENFGVVVLEKIHGANFSVWISNDEIRFAKRTSFLGENESFFDYQNTIANTGIKEVSKLIFNTLKEMFKVKFIVITGELFGKGVQKEVNYAVKTSNGKDIKFFDIQLEDGRFLSWEEIEYMLQELNSEEVTNTFVKPIKVCTIKEALEFPKEFLSTYNPVDKNFAEGVVIKGYKEDKIVPKGGRLIIKRKHPNFKEFGDKVPKVKKERAIEDNFNFLFRRYINENRIDSAESKLGKFESMSQMGVFIKEILGDAKTDFMKDFEVPMERFKPDMKLVFNVGSTIAEMLKERLCTE